MDGMNDMKGIDREALMKKIETKLVAATDEELKAIADDMEVGADEVFAANEVQIDAPLLADKPVNTGALTGPLPDLKSFLIKKQRDNESK